jgi:superfamily II DNA or RNA helicase
MTYTELLERKKVRSRDFGITPGDTSETLFDFQRTATEFAIRKGRAALFLDTGLGKTICQLEWANQIPGEVLILAPVAVAPQTVREAKERLGFEIGHSRDGSVNHRVTITNYERLHLFDASRFAGVVLDESSILKSFSGKTKQLLCERFSSTPYRLACTATPSPNDHMELGNHSDFLGIMPQGQMLARWFINDTNDTGTWRLKGHAVKSFWEWIASWAVCASKPSDLGDDSRYDLPPLTQHLHVVESPVVPNIETGFLFGHAELSATNMHADKRNTMEERVGRAVELSNTGDYCLIWCESNAESAALKRAIADSVEVVGSDDQDEKEAKLDAFSRGEVRVMITKPSIAGFGLNWQHCNHVIFASLSYSYESYYQAIRRTWRFGQKRPVRVDAIIADSEQGIWRTIRAKMDAHDEMKSAMRTASKTLHT